MEIYIWIILILKECAENNIEIGLQEMGFECVD
jgi:hypothetical protein